MAEREGSDTTIESDIESDFDVMEEIDPSFDIDASLWKKIKDFDEVDLKPAAPVLPEGAEKQAEKPKKKEAEAEEEDSGFSELVVTVRSEKDRDLEFQEYIRELCRPQIVSYLPDRVAAKGSNVRLTCTVEGNNVQTKWFKNEEPMERKPNVQTKTDGEIHILEITSITEKDAGVYTANFKNRAGEVETSSRIKVFDGKLHKPDHIDIALVKDYYDHALGGLVIEAHVHGLPLPNVKFYRDGHLLHARKNKIVFFCENKEIYQCLMVRPDASVSGTYTVMADSKAGKKRYDHHVDFVTKYPLIHLPGMRHADKKLEDFVDEMLEKIPKQPEAPPAPEVPAPEANAEAPKEEEPKPEVQQPPKAEEIAEALQAVAEPGAPTVEGEAGPAVEEKPKKHHKSKSKHRKKKASTPKIDADLVDDGEDEPETDALEVVGETEFKRKYSTVVHEPYETESFRIFNAKYNCWFSGKLHDQTVIEGSTVKLVCTVSGPMSIMKWLKNGKPVPWSATVRNLSGEGLGSVIIEKIQKGDAGVYTCSAKNQFNEVTTESVIKVIPRSTVPRSDESKPHFTRVLAESYHNAEDDLVLEAHVRAVPEPKITWLKDGIELTTASDSRFDFSSDHDGGYQLRIHKPKTEDSALYACEAVNSAGKAKITHKVIFHEYERHTHPQFVYHKESFWQPSLRMSIEPDPVKESSVPAPEISQAATQPKASEAQLPSSGGAADQAAPTSEGGAGEAPAGDSGSGGDGNEDGEQGKDGSKLPEDGEEATDGEAQEGGEGEAQQEAKQQAKRPKKGRKRYEGPVEPLLIRDSTKRISFSVTLRDITAPAGSNIKLCCQIAGPGPQVKWLKNEKPIDQSPKLRIPKKDGWGLITIDKAQASDSGIYRCCASNSFNVIYTEAKVTIFDIEEVAVKPTFTRITDYYRQDVDDYIIEVQVRGTPTPSIVFTRDGVPLETENSEKFLVMREPEGVYKLCIHDPQKIDGGRFIVEAANKAGKEEIRRTIRLLGKEQYKYLPGIHHADPKKPHEKEEDDGSMPIIEEVAPAAPESDEPEMDKWGNIKPKKEKKIRLREKVFMPPSAEEIERESLVLKQVRNHLEFESDLKNQVSQVGTKVKLLCTVSGPKPSLTWFKDDEPFEFDPPKIKNTSSGSFGSITFLSVAEKDSGVYKCVAKNTFCEASSECTLTVTPVQDPNWIKPAFTRLLKEYYDQKCNNLVLEVHVRGYPRPTLVWNKDGLDVDEGDDKYFATRHPDGVYRLNIYDPMIRDSGRYGCTATNLAGNEILKYYLKVKSKDEYIHTAGLYHADPTQFAKYKEEEERKRQERLAYRPPPRPQPEEKPVEAQEKPESDIEESEGEAEESEYEGEVEYDEEGEELPRKKKEKPVQPKEPTPPPKEPTPPPKEPTPPPQPVVDTAEVAEAAPKKERNWLQGAPEGIPQPVSEKPKISKYHLEFLTPLENRTGVENTGVKLFCQIAGPNPQVSWLFNDTPLKSTDNIKNVSNENVAALSFLKASPEHSGEYTCIVKNRECKIEATCYLNVLEVPKPPEKGIAPNFPFGIKHSFISQTDELIIECAIRGTPRLFIKWYKDAKQVENDDKYLMSRDGEVYKLYVHKPTFRDSGIYLLQVENTYGMEFLKYVIEFERKDEPVVSGFIYHADLTKTKKYQDNEAKKKQERLARKLPPRPKTESAAVEAPKAEVVEVVEDDEEPPTEYETTDSEYDEEGEKIEKEPRKKPKGPSKAELRRIRLAEEKAKREAEEARLKAEREEEERKIREEEERKVREEAERKAKLEAEKKAEEEAEKLAAEEAAKAAADALAALEACGKNEIQKPLHVFRAHKIVEFRKNADVPLEIVKRLLSSYVKVKSKLKLSCCVSEGDPRIKAIWYKNGEPLEIDARFNANATEDGLITLEFKEIDFEDAGRYKVVIKTKKGDISSECDVGIYGEEEKRVEDVPPTLLKAVCDWYRPVYNDVIIEIYFRGSPKPTVEWTFSKDGLPINPWKQYAKYQVKHDEVNGHYTQQLIIADPNQYRDNGKYIIRLENRAGIVIMEHILSFEGKKIEPKRKRMDDIFIVNEVPRVNPKPKSPTPPPVVVEVQPEEVKEEEAEEEAEEEVEEEEEDEE